MKQRVVFPLSMLICLALVGYTFVRLMVTTTAPPTHSAELPEVLPTSVDGHPVKSWKNVEDFERELAILETVFWDPRDTESLRNQIRQPGAVEGKTVLEIGTGSGLLSLCFLKAGAGSVTATDVNPAAVANARFNAQRLNLSKSFEVRLVPLENSAAYSVIQPEEQFDLIISNPPWVNQEPQTIDEYALYDANFALLQSLLDGLPQHLKPGGKVWLAYGCVDAIKTIQKLCQERDYEVTILDSRELDDLPEEFLPGMLLEIRLPAPSN